jgi:ribose-phosphate pyrophosphokinase
MNGQKVFTGSSNPELARKIARYLGTSLGQARIDQFPDGELIVKLDDDVRGRDVFVIQSTCHPVNRNLMELLIFIDCLRRASARRITAVLPYFGYARQDRKDEGRVPISAKLVANLITQAGAQRILTIDLHAAQIQGFFDIPVDHLLAEPVFSSYFLKIIKEEVVLVSPDVGNIKRARIYAQHLEGDIAIIDKRRISGSEAVVQNIIGDVRGKHVVMIDDMVATAGTICEAAKLVRSFGASRVTVGATHPVLCGPAIERLSEAPIDNLVVADTIPLDGKDRYGDKKIEILTVSELLGEAIRRIHRDESVSSLFLK